MSIENALTEHAAAIRELAAAIRSIGGGFVSGALLATDTVAPDATGAVSKEELEKAVAKVEADAKAKEAADKKAKADAAAKAKQEKADKEAAEAKAKAEAEAKDKDSGDDLGLGGDDEKVPDFKTEVRPALLAAIKRTSKAEVQALVQSYGVEKADEIDPKHYADALAKANAMGA